MDVYKNTNAHKNIDIVIVIVIDIVIQYRFVRKAYENSWGAVAPWADKEQRR